MSWVTLHRHGRIPKDPVDLDVADNPRYFITLLKGLKRVMRYAVYERVARSGSGLASCPTDQETMGVVVKDEGTSSLS
jgi:hypothetical protein